MLIHEILAQRIAPLAVTNLGGVLAPDPKVSHYLKMFVQPRVSQGSPGEGQHVRHTVCQLFPAF